MSFPPRFRPDQDQHQPTPQVINLHAFLRSTQEPVMEHIYSHILWDLRENPLTSAQQVGDLGKQLSPEFLNTHATEPPVPFLNVVCEYPKHWSLVVSASALNIGGNGGGANTAGARNSYPVYSPPAPMAGSSAPYHPYFRSSSASPQRPPIDDIPPTPVIPTVPLPGTAGTSSRKVGVTISDLLLAVYNHLHTKTVGSMELDALPSKQRVKLTEAFDKRSKMTQGIGDGESVLASPTSPTSATFPFHPTFSSLSAATVPAVTPSVAFTPTLASTTDAGGVKLMDTLLNHTLFAGMDIVAEREWTVILSLKRPS